MRLYVADLSFDGQLQRSVGKPDSGWPTHGIPRRCPGDRPGCQGRLIRPGPYSGADWPRRLNAETATRVNCPPFVRDGASSLSEKPSLNENKQRKCLSRA